MKKHIKYLLGIVLLVQLSSCGADEGFSDFDAVLEITGENLDKGYARTGYTEGYSWWTFNGSDLQVEYTVQLYSGDVRRAVEQYTINNLKPSYTYDGVRNELTKGYWGDWGDHRFYFGLKHNEDGYSIKFQVTWNKTAYCTFLYKLSGEDEEKLLKRLLITDEADENFIEAKEEYMSEVGLEEYRALKSDIQELSRAIGSLDLPSNLGLSNKSLFYIDEFNRTIDDNSESLSPLYLDINNAQENSITIDNNPVSLSVFKEGLAGYVQKEIDSLDLSEYLYITTEHYRNRILRGYPLSKQYRLYHHSDRQNLSPYTTLGLLPNEIEDLYFELGLPKPQRISNYYDLKSEYPPLAEADYKPFFKKVQDTIARLDSNTLRMNQWNDIYLILCRNNGGMFVNSFIVFTGHKSNDFDYYKKFSLDDGAAFYSFYDPKYYNRVYHDSDVYYSLHDRVSMFAKGRKSYYDTTSVGYNFAMEDLIGLYAVEYLNHRISDFQFNNAQADEKYVVFKLSSNDKIFSKLNFDRGEDTFSWTESIKDTISISTEVMDDYYRLVNEVDSVEGMY
jgi:hypothetical protein